MKKIRPFLLVISILLGLTVNGQLNFNRNSAITVLNANGDTLKNAWAGGFNSVQFSEIDLDLDGTKDLFVFDRTGNRISTFINTGVTNQISYQHDPQYVQNFPVGLYDWVLLRDFNCDGKEDIFTFSNGGMKVYKNTSTTVLSFTLETNQVVSDNQPDSVNPNYLNILLSSVDLPAIDDIDNDGDIDLIVSSIVPGRFIYHKNLTMEQNGNCSVLDFQIRNKCWGYISEHPTQNKAIFNDTCTNNISTPEKPGIPDKHLGGSSLFTLDADASNSKDLVVGGNTYRNLLLLYNDDLSPNLTQSSITTANSFFPRDNLNTIEVDLDHFPAGFYTDINNDGVKDLVVSTNGLTFTRNNLNVMLYENNGATNNPDFNFTTNSFIQEGMIEVGEGVNSAFFDYNADGLMDIVIGNYGVYDSSSTTDYTATLWLYENKGTVSNPYFQLVDSNYVNISSLNLDVASSRKTLGLAPTFGDIDGDNDIDMILGDYIGKVHYFENTAGAGNTANFVLNQAQYAGIVLGTNASPQLIDLNRDNKLDLVAGKGDGYYSYFENTGTVNAPIFSLITDSLGKVNTKRYTDFKGNSKPFIYDDGGSYRMISGSSNGYLYEFGNIDGNLTGTFSMDSTFLNIWEGVNSSVSLFDIDNDTYLDMIVGNQSGGAAYYSGAMVSNINSTLNQELNEINIYPNPSSNYINIDLGINEIDNSTIEIINLLGKIVHSQAVKNTKIVVNLSALTQGVYFVKFSNDKGQCIEKVIKH